MVGASLSHVSPCCLGGSRTISGRGCDQERKTNLPANPESLQGAKTLCFCAHHPLCSHKPMTGVWAPSFYKWELERVQTFPRSHHQEGFLGGSDSKESTCNAGDLGSIPGLGRSHGGEHGNPLQYSCLENAMDREAWRATVHRVTKSPTWLSD